MFVLMFLWSCYDTQGYYRHGVMVCFNFILVDFGQYVAVTSPGYLGDVRR